jgi:Histidine kinase
VLPMVLLELIPVALWAGGRNVPFPVALTGVDAALVSITLALHHFGWQRFRASDSSTMRFAAGAILAVLVGVLGAFTLDYFWRRPSPPAFPAPGLVVVLTMGFLSSLLQIGIWSLAVYVPALLSEQRSLRAEANELRTRAELGRLRGQLEPHFLLNTLNLISSLVVSQPHKSRIVIGALGDLLRDALAEHDEMQSLNEQIDWLRRYTDILEARYGSLLTVEWNIDASVAWAQLPRLILQPLVENAIIHGALKRRGGGRVIIRAEPTLDNRLLRCIVHDNGPGALSMSREGAVGVDNVRRRLAIHHPESSLELKSLDSGTQSVLCYPLQGPQ